MRSFHSLRSIPLALLAALVGLSACDGGSSTTSPEESAVSPLATAPYSACATEMSRTAAGTLIGLTLTDSGHMRLGIASRPIRQCQWFSLSGGLSGLSSVNWQWHSSASTYEAMKTNYAANKVRTLADGRVCVREAAFDARYLYRIRQVAGRETMSVEFADSTCAADGADEQVWTVCRGTTLVGSVDRPGQTSAWKLQRADSVVARICRAS
jgi:hypothetical protein